MPKLTFVAENVCGAPSPFVLLGQEPKERQPGRDEGLVIEFATERPAMHTVLTLKADRVWPGQLLHQEAELPASDAYDVRKLSWVVPDEYRGRFFLRQLSWGAHNLLGQPGIV